MTDLPDWVAVGAKVAVNETGHWRDSVRIHTVERLTATQIVLDNGTRVDRATLYVRGKGGRLLALTDPTVTRARARRQIGELRHDLDTLLRDFNSDADAAVALVERAAARVAAAHASIVNL